MSDRYRFEALSCLALASVNKVACWFEKHTD